MRRPLTAFLVMVALFAGGCSADRSGSSAPSSTPPPAVPSASEVGDAAGAADPGTLAANTAEVCAAARKAGTDAVGVFVPELAKMVQATANNDTQGAKAAQDAAAAALRGWQSALTAQAARATDPELARTLTGIAAEVGRLTADVATLDDAKLDQLSDALTAICG